MRLTHRHITLAASVAVVAVVAAAAFGWWAVALGVVALMQAIGLVLLWNVRQRAARREDLNQAVGEIAEARRQIQISEEAILDAVQQSRSGVQEELRGVRSRVDEAQRNAEQAIEIIGRRLERSSSRRTREIEAMLQIFPRMSLRAGMPSTTGWAIDATGILHLIDLVDAHRPDLIVELGSGTSSVWLGYALESVGTGRLISFEHHLEYARRTTAELRRHRLDDTVEVRIAELRPSPVPGHETEWYDPVAFADLVGIDMLLIDGPPGRTGPFARYPAVPVLHDRLSADALVVLDDVNREGERDIVQRWCREYPGWQAEPQRSSRLAVLSRRSGPQGG